MSDPRQPRITALDGLRGVLALVVMLDHLVILATGSTCLHLAATASVWVFFAMSARVLAPRWDGRFGIFLLKRAARLLPTYALGWALGCLVQHGIDLPERVDPPAWSLDWEFLAMLLFPPILGLAATRRRAALGSAAALILGLTLFWPVAYLAPFILGAAATRWRPRSALLERRVPQWLGHVSYSLYLIHWPVLALAQALGGRAGLLIGAALVLPLAHLACALVEAPAIRLSQAIGRNALNRK